MSNGVRDGTARGALAGVLMEMEAERRERERKLAPRRILAELEQRIGEVDFVGSGGGEATMVSI